MNMGNKLAIISIVAASLSFVQLFGLEKAILAIVIGVFALKEIASNAEEKGTKKAIAGIIIACVYILVLLIVMIVKWPEIVSVFTQIK
jgi:hypothetical protein